MSQELMQRGSDALAISQGGQLLPRLPRRVQQAVEAQVALGLVRAARVQAEVYVAHTLVDGASLVARTGMQRVAELSAEEVHYSAQTPLGEARFRAIAESYAALANHEVVKLGYNR